MVTTAPSPAFRQRIERIIRQQDAQDVARIRGIEIPRHQWAPVSAKPKAKPAAGGIRIAGRCSKNPDHPPLKRGSDRCSLCYKEWRKTRRLQKPPQAADDS